MAQDDDTPLLNPKP